MKKYFKKSISLFLAVLMLMSCWVWVAPEKAEAAYTGYTVTITYEVYHPATAGGHVEFDFGNGYETVIGSTNMNNSKDEITVKKWPQKIRVTGKTINSQGKKFDVDIVGVKINDRTVMSGRIELPQRDGYIGASVASDSAEFYPTNDAGTDYKINARTYRDVKFDWPKPNIVETQNSAGDDIAFTLNKIPGDDIVKNPTGQFYSIKDTNYNIEWPVTTKAYLAENETDVFEDALTKMGSPDIYYDSATDQIVATANLQTEEPNENGRKVYYFIRTSSYTDADDLVHDYIDRAKVTITWPTYTVSVYPNGGSMKMTGGSTTEQNNVWSVTKYYGREVTEYPVGGSDGASRPGYLFKGFWTSPQPASGSSSVNAATTAFATPISSENYDKAKTKGAVVSTENVVVNDVETTVEIITIDGKKYYNGGAEWDADKDIRIETTKSFYAWWLAKDITVKFYDIDGAYLGSKVAKAGSKPDATWYLNPKYDDSYSTGAFTYSRFEGQWMDITGQIITAGEYTFGDIEQLVLTPVYADTDYKENHKVNFVNPNSGLTYTQYSKNYAYRHILEGTEIPSMTIPAVLSNDLTKSYVFEGWTSQVPANGRYHAVAVGDVSVNVASDMVVRSDITYYAVFRSTAKMYAVSFTYTDTAGNSNTEVQYVPYGSVIATPDSVNQTYAQEGYGYTFKHWKYQNQDRQTGYLGYTEDLLFTTENVYLTVRNVAGYTPETPFAFTAEYDSAPTPYTITFKYKDAYGNEVSKVGSVDHGNKITQDIVGQIDVPEEYDDGAALYNFADLWVVTEGSADKTNYTIDEFVNFAPTSHVTFEAVYDEGTPFYTVTYIDVAGETTYSERALEGHTIPAWLVSGKPYVPATYKDEKGTYTFAGWFDQKQTDKECEATNGTEYTDTSVVTGDITLYSQFLFEPFKFPIKFMNYNGTEVLAEVELEEGLSYADTLALAEEKAAERTADKIYSYTFVGWNEDPGNCICLGKEKVYIAQYRTNYIEYKARWYTDYDAMINAELPEMEVVGSNGLLAVTSHIYNGFVYAPVTNITVPDGKVFNGWKYQKDGEEADYVRGMAITENMSFYATFKDAPVLYTLKTSVNGIINTYEVGENTTFEVAGTPADGYVDSANHNKFIGWYDADGNLIDLSKEITENITIYARFETSPHNMSMTELVKAPTYYVEGAEYKWCNCSKEDTIAKDNDGNYLTTAIPVLKDTKAPTGTIYLGGKSWSSTGAPAYETDNQEISIFVNADADVVITTNDTGDVDAKYNPSGYGIGVKKIRAFAFPAKYVLTADNYGAAQSLAIDVYANKTTDLNNNANFSVKLGDFIVADLDEDGKVQYEADGTTVKYKSLEDGEAYIIYYYVNDKATEANGAAATGNQLNSKVRTAKFIYDTTAPSFEITGNSNAETTTIPTVTYCATATVTGIEEGATLTVNGDVVALTDGKYVISEEDTYLVAVTDKAGNSTYKKIKVNAAHKEVNASQEATCTANGYEKITCAVCNTVIKEETITSEGHKYGGVTTVAPTCEDEGYDVEICSVCGFEWKTNEKAAAGHTYEKDNNGNTLFTVIKAATCKEVGKGIANCTVCGKGTVTQEIPADTTNGHAYGSVKTLKPTCTAKGEEYQYCKYCYEKKVVKIIAPLNHVNTGTYTKITTAATCIAKGEETTYCKACNAEMGKAPVEMIAHTLVLVKYDTYMQYECKATDCEYNEGRSEIVAKKEYTVTFVGAGVDGTDLKITKTAGESVEKEAVTEPTKPANVEHKYTFAGWKAESSGKIVKLPVKVTKNETYTAEFTATAQVYTHQFVDEEGNEIANIVGNYNDENKKTSIIPTKPATRTEKYEFKGWIKAGDSDIATDFTMKDDATFTAYFETVPVKYTVIYIYGTTILESHKVDGGAGVPAYTGSTKVLVKDYDSNYHYEFEKWSIATDTPVYADTYIQPVFKAIKHIYDEGEVTKAPTCVTTGVMTFTCDCGKKKTDSIPATGQHTMVDDVCVNCGYTDTQEMVSIIFKDEERGPIYSTSVLPGETVTYDVVPTKDSTAQYMYTFKGWKLSGADDSTATKQTEFVVNEDVVYVAVFKAETRTYTVTYYNGGQTVKKFENVQYGAFIPEYEYTEDPKKDYNDNEHYVFVGWSINNRPTCSIDKVITEKIIGDTAVYAKYATVRHTLGDIVSGTCSESAHQICTVCGYKYYVPGASEVAHTPDADSVIVNDSTFDATGTKSYYCTSCDKTITETIPVKSYYFINIMVWNDDGSEAQYVNVKLKHNGEFYDYYADGKETVDGFVSFKVDKSLDKKLWSAYIVGGGIEGGISGAVKTATNTDTNINEFNKPEADVETPDVPQPEEPEEPECSCSCHKNTFWGMIFRFFQKIVRLFGGKDCCADARK